MRAVLSRGHHYAVSRTFHTISAVGGIRGRQRAAFVCRQDLNDPPTAEDVEQFEIRAIRATLLVASIGDGRD